MKIKSFCDLIIAYNGIFDFFIDTGFGELPDLTPSPALDSFVSSYSELGGLIFDWEAAGLCTYCQCNETLSF